MSAPVRPSAAHLGGAYVPPVGAAALLPRLANGPVTIERGCTGCASGACHPGQCEAASRFERLVDELQILEERGLVRLWLRNFYSVKPGARPMARARLTDAGRAELVGAR